MLLRKNPLARITLLVVFVIPVIAWVFIKPVRVIAPEIFGIECFQNGVCVDNPGQFDEAATLHSEAVEFLNERIHPIEAQSKVIFCSTNKCADVFGLGKRSAVTFGTLGSVIGPRAWKPYYVRHELIHQLQGEQLGVLKCLILPSWLIEGMAYSLSEDPRNPLQPPWQGYRTRFNKWLDQVGVSNMWQKAAQEW